MHTNYTVGLWSCCSEGTNFLIYMFTDLTEARNKAEPTRTVFSGVSYKAPLWIMVISGTI